jgi:predicted metal-dependent HD superfamily phosphohydrolase
MPSHRRATSGSAAARAWIEAVRQLGGSADTAIGAAAELDRRYAESHRGYHGTAHVEAVVRDCAQLADELGLDCDARALVTLAACAHDVVYDGRPGADERASADWARRHLAASAVAATGVERVGELVLATTTHAAADGDLLAAVLLDADLAILGAPPDAYIRYMVAVRKEYASVPDDQWRTGRTHVLTDLAARRRLYVTEPARRRWAAQARRNLATELAGLR